MVESDRCVCPGNGGNGITLTNTQGLGCGTASLHACVTNRNNASGVAIDCTSGGSVRRCESSNNGVNGFVVSGNGHTVVENIAASNTVADFSVPTPGNSLGPIVSEATLPQSTNPAANYTR